jgi:hypothetical protein
MADRRANATPSGAKVCVTKFTGAYLSRGSSRTSRDVPAAMMLEDIEREAAEEGAAERLFLRPTNPATAAFCKDFRSLQWLSWLPRPQRPDWVNVRTASLTNTGEANEEDHGTRGISVAGIGLRCVRQLG